tara:strand:- start:359 stop:478 length:120 start_codon:yes stop_codon:yes gene_type:complete
MFVEALVLFGILMVFAWYWIVEPRFGPYIPEDWSNKEEE